MQFMMDLFSMQFNFSINKRRRGKKTIIGKLATVLIALSGMGYLMFLLINFFQNNFLPKITETTKINTQNNSFKFEKSPFSVRFMFQGPAPENFVLERFIGVSVQVGIALTNQLEQITLGKCKDIYPYYQDEYIDEDLCLPSGIEFKYFYNDQLKMYLEQGVYLTIFECMGPHCASQAEIDDFLTNYQFYMWLSFNYDEYDYGTEKIIQQKRQKLIILERDLTIFSLFYAQKTEIEVDTGYVLKQINKKEYIHGYEEDNQKLSQKIIPRFPQFDQILTPVYGFFVFPIRLNSRSIKVEYPKITELIAQFVSVVNLALLVRFLIRHISEIKIFEHIMEDMIKFYYQKSLKECKKLDLEDKKNSGQGNSDPHLFHHNIFWSLKVYVQNKFRMKKKLKTEEDVNNLNEKQLKVHKQEQVYENLYDITQNQVEIDSLFKEILQLKTCVQILLSKEQYAAVKFVGRNIPNKAQKQCFSEQTLNHLEVQDLIDRNTVICQKYFHDFYSNKNNNSYQSQKSQQENNKFQNNKKTKEQDINDRILKSLIEQSEKLDIQKEILQNHGINNDHNTIEQPINSNQINIQKRNNSSGSQNISSSTNLIVSNLQNVNKNKNKLDQQQQQYLSDKNNNISNPMKQQQQQNYEKQIHPEKVIGSVSDVENQIHSIQNLEDNIQSDDKQEQNQNKFSIAEISTQNIIHKNDYSGTLEMQDLSKIEEFLEQKPLN